MQSPPRLKTVFGGEVPRFRGRCRGADDRIGEPGPSSILGFGKVECNRQPIYLFKTQTHPLQRGARDCTPLSASPPSRASPRCSLISGGEPTARARTSLFLSLTHHMPTHASVLPLRLKHARPRCIPPHTPRSHQSSSVDSPRHHAPCTLHPKPKP